MRYKLLLTCLLVVGCGSDTATPYEWQFGENLDAGSDVRPVDVAADLPSPPDLGPSGDAGSSGDVGIDVGPEPNPVAPLSCLAPSVRIGREGDDLPVGLGVANRSMDSVVYWSDRMRRYVPETDEWIFASSLYFTRRRHLYSQVLVTPEDELALIALERHRDRTSIRDSRFNSALLNDYVGVLQSVEGELSHVEALLDADSYPVVAWSRREAETSQVEFARGEPEPVRLKYNWTRRDYAASRVLDLSLALVGDDVWVGWFEADSSTRVFKAMRADTRQDAELTADVVHAVVVEVRDLELHTHDDGSLVATWVERDAVDSLVAMRRTPQGAWSAPETLTVGTISEVETLSLGSRTIAVWLREEDGEQAVASAHFDQGAWSSIRSISRTAGQRSLLRLVEYAGEAIVFWVNERDLGDTISMARFDTTAAGWSDPTRFERALDDVIDLAVSGGSAITATWTHRVENSPNFTAHNVRVKRCRP